VYTTEESSSIIKRLIGAVGGLTVVTLVIFCVVFVACFGGIFVLVTGQLKSSEPYQLALEKAQSNPEVVEALGEPIEPGFWVLGTISTGGISGEADLQFPISGPKNRGMIYITARRENAVWRFYTLAVHVDGQDELIDLR
jgi:hypothetical protein